MFSKGYFTFWVIVAMVWGVWASATITIMPLWESWTAISTVMRGLFTNDDVHARMRADHFLSHRPGGSRRRRPGTCADPMKCSMECSMECSMKAGDLCRSDGT